MCRMCGETEETGTHVALVCPEEEWLGRRWSNWMQMGEKERWKRKKKEGDREVTIDLAEDFFANLNL